MKVDWIIHLELYEEIKIQKINSANGNFEVTIHLFFTSQWLTTKMIIIE